MSAAVDQVLADAAAVIDEALEAELTDRLLEAAAMLLRVADDFGAPAFRGRLQALAAPPGQGWGLDVTHETMRTPEIDKIPQRPDPGGPSKTCRKCGRTKPLSDYYAKPGARDGLFAECKACILEARRAAYQARPEMRERIRAQARAWKAQCRQRVDDASPDPQATPHRAPTTR